MVKKAKMVVNYKARINLSWFRKTRISTRNGTLMFLLIGKSRMKIRRHTYIALEKGGRLVKVGEVLDDFPVKRTGHVMKNQMKCCHS